MQQPRDFSMYGAVDLGARQAAAQRQQQAAARSANASSAVPANGVADDGQASSFVIDVTEETFNTDVALKSRTVPVIVDLWADWCGPCKQLSPVLEKLANEAAGSWLLAKIDVDANPRLAQAFQAQSIPMVVAIVGGQMVDAFLGAMPEAQVRQWLAQVLTVAEQLGVKSDPVAGGPAEPAEAEPSPIDLAQEAMERDDMDGAAAIIDKALTENPNDPVLKSLRAQIGLFRRVDSYDQESVSRAAANPKDIDAQLQLADLILATGQAEDAFDRILGVIKRTAGADRDKARRHLIELFEILPPDDDRVKKARTQLTALLF